MKNHYPHKHGKNQLLSLFLAVQNKANSEYMLSKDEFNCVKELNEAINHYKEDHEEIDKDLTSPVKVAHVHKLKKSRNLSIFDENRTANFEKLLKPAKIVAGEKQKRNRVFSVDNSHRSIEQPKHSTRHNLFDLINKTKKKDGGELEADNYNFEDYSHNLLTKLEFKSIAENRNHILRKITTPNREEFKNIENKEDMLKQLFQCNPVLGFSKRKKRLRLFKNLIIKSKANNQLRKLKKIVAQHQSEVAELNKLSAGDDENKPKDATDVLPDINKPKWSPKDSIILIKPY